MSYQNIKVIAYSGYRGEEVPRAFFINEEKITVVDVLDMRTEESMSCQGRRRFFMVRGNDCRKYKIYYDEKILEWFFQLMNEEQ